MPDPNQRSAILERAAAKLAGDTSKGAPPTNFTPDQQRALEKLSEAEGAHARGAEFVSRASGGMQAGGAPVVTSNPTMDAALAPVTSRLPAPVMRMVQPATSAAQVGQPPTMQLVPTQQPAPTNFGYAPPPPPMPVAPPVVVAPSSGAYGEMYSKDLESGNVATQPIGGVPMPLRSTGTEDPMARDIRKQIKREGGK